MSMFVRVLFTYLCMVKGLFSEVESFRMIKVKSCVLWRKAYVYLMSR